MTAPILPTDPSQSDVEAFKKIIDQRQGRLTSMRSRAEKWIAGLTALVTVLATATVVAGPDNFSDIPTDHRDTVLGLILAGGACIALGLIAAYSAAFGGLVKRSEVDRIIEDTTTVSRSTNAQLNDAVDKDTKSARQYLRAALALTVVGTICLALATAASWTTKPADDDSVCLTIGGQKVVFKSAPEVKSGDVHYGC